MQVGAALWCGFSFCLLLTKEELFPKQALVWFLIFSLVGFALCFNPVLDLISGLQVLEGRVTDVKVWEEVRKRYGGSPKTVSVRFEKATYARVHLKIQDKEQIITESSLRGLEMIEAFKRCHQNNGVARVTLLRHLDVVLEVECSVG